MNIGYLYDFHAFPPRGGNHVHAMELMDGFLRSGHKVFVVDDPTMPGVTNFGNRLTDIQAFVKQIDVLYVRIDARDLRRWQALKKAVSLASLIPVVWEINSPANETLAYSWLGGRSGDGKQGVIRYLRRWLHATRKLPSVFLEERYRRKLAKHVRTAICVSKSLAEYANEALSIDDVLILPNGGVLLSEDEIQKQQQDKEFTVLYTGSAMYPWQGLDYLAEVIALAKDQAPGIRFKLVVNQRTPELPSSDNAVILEHLGREQILQEICSASACVSLHPKYPWSRYGFHNSPMKMFEYMACMRPVVTSNHGQMKDIINDGRDGLLCENKPDDILDKLVWLKDNPKKAKDIGRNGWARIQNEFSWRGNVEKTLAVFERVVKKQ